jgi:ribonucleoside-diphosphate reductase alpha chain
VNNLKFDNYEYDEISVQVWEDNYKGSSELTRKDTWDRAAKACAAVENTDVIKQVEEEFKKILYNDRFVPGGRILANLGLPGRDGTTMYNCFVHNPEDIKLKDADSIDGIYDLLKAQAKTLKSEGGYGINASFIRPAGTYIEGIGSRTPGVLKFMELWDKSSEIITQGSTKILGKKKSQEKNKIRKGAQMLIVEVWHPDVKDFIVAKQTPGRLTKFNVSVGITPGFMEALESGSDWELKFPDTTFPAYKEEWFGDIHDWTNKGYPVVIYETVKASEIWELIMKSTYNRNEPGVLFLDVANRLNPVYWCDKIKTTNPCGEVPMSTGVCNLGSLNLVTFVKVVDGVPTFDFDEFAKAVGVAIRFLDNINSISATPLPEYSKSVQEKRRIGLGVMGLGSLHFMLGIRYGSAESLELVKKLYKTKTENEILASALLGQEKGSFVLFDKDKYFVSEWWKNLQISDQVKKQVECIGCMRNSHQSMNAPTGNTGIYARNVSGGVEPVFGSEGYFRWSIVPETRRRGLVEQGFKFPDVGKGEWFETEHLKFSTRGDEQILKGSFGGKDFEVDKNRGLVVGSFVEDYGMRFARTFYKNFNELKSNGAFTSAEHLSVDDHLSVLAIASHYTNMAISKTINIPEDYSYEDFKKIYLYAWKNNIKGVTSYRANTMTAVIETKESNAKVKTNAAVFTENHAPKRLKELPCEIVNATVNGEKWTFIVGLYEDKPYEIFGGLSKFVQIPRRVKSGKVTKWNGSDNPIARYDLHYDYDKGPEDETVIKDITSVFENKTYAAFTRTISLSLRHGVPIQYVVEQLLKGSEKEDDLFSFSRAVTRVLKGYIKDGTKPTAKQCPACNSTNLIYQEGCVTCKDCGNSKCG